MRSVSDLTINILTRNRPNILPGILASIVNQGIKDYELKIMDMSDTSITSYPYITRILDLISTFARVEIIHIVKSLPEARQYMLLGSREYCMFVDDDVLLGEGVIGGLYMNAKLLSIWKSIGFVCPIIDEIINLRDRPDWQKIIFPTYPAIVPYGDYQVGQKINLLMADTACIIIDRIKAVDSNGFNPVSFEEYLIPADYEISKTIPLEHVLLTTNLLEHNIRGKLITDYHVWHLPVKSAYTYANCASTSIIQNKILKGLKNKYEDVLCV